MQKDVFVHPYLERLKLHDNLLPDISALRRIHKQHLLNIPFEREISLEITGQTGDPLLELTFTLREERNCRHANRL
ncbi:hypothetical protein PDUR_05050 [Paenibacillus durus]|uniref:Uncharacterized protein n=1 Tax=Paenibacillus durus TaxID=44251 RepID=A0A089HM42_PAEDU|nr:hypothetical protein PDUR_05050 [Paenibacillus durus]